MIATIPNPSISPGADLRELFKAAYENRYTWDPDFPGYEGCAIWESGERRCQGRFRLGCDLRAELEGFEDAEVHKAVASQLWEVAIHRVRRPFDQIHGQNSFLAGDTDAVGTEVIVSGKAAGDRYRIKGNVVTMVHRHIHGSVVTIFTESVTHTGLGYLSRTYTSQYSDPTSGAPRGDRNRFTDTFAPLGDGGPWVLRERLVENLDESGSQHQTLFRFEDLNLLS